MHFVSQISLRNTSTHQDVMSAQFNASVNAGNNAAQSDMLNALDTRIHKVNFYMKLELSYALSVVRHETASNNATMGFISGFLGRFLSSKCFIPLSKLSNCILMIHPLITRAILLDSEQTFHLSFTIVVSTHLVRSANVLLMSHSTLQLTTYIGFLVLSFIAGFILYMFFEAPLTSLLQSVYQKSGK